MTMEVSAGASLSSQGARALTDRIRAGVEAVWQLVEQAYVSRAWAVLGYTSWDDYCTREFGTSRIRLPREERQEVVASLRESGLSLRAIAAATGVDRKTLRRDLEQVGEMGPPESGMNSITGTDGKTYMPKPHPEPASAADDRFISQDELDELNQPPPRPPKRKPLNESFFQAQYDMRKAIERVHRLTDDDRFHTHKHALAGSHGEDLKRAAALLQEAIERINGDR
ncbi:hypothetical protein [Prescottella agglutinans]|uniref:Transposase-like protein n=1 Tax=Prescottella agglutinans TaxID=1644129 RepID=A0ABT6MFP3_9NOCA|nr:hypothetical protein [Prescottella agglutinans]MDH6283141.1 transposase-like protein [Prescottella agglutinans]